MGVYGLPNNQILEKAERPATEKEHLPLGNYNDYHISESLEKHLEKNKEDLFFYAVGFRKPHLPFVAPKKFWELYDSSEIQVSDYDTAPIDGDTIVYSGLSWQLIKVTLKTISIQITEIRRLRIKMLKN